MTTPREDAIAALRRDVEYEVIEARRAIHDGNRVDVFALLDIIERLDAALGADAETPTVEGAASVRITYDGRDVTQFVVPQRPGIGFQFPTDLEADLCPVVLEPTPHQYDIACKACGQPGQVTVSIVPRAALGADAETPDDTEPAMRRRHAWVDLASPEIAEALRSAYDEVTESMSPGEAGFFAAVLAAMRGTGR